MNPTPDITRIPIKVDELLTALGPHLMAVRDNAYAGRYRAATLSATQAAHRLLDLIGQLQHLTDEEVRL